LDIDLAATSWILNCPPSHFGLETEGLLTVGTFSGELLGWWRLARLMFPD
jgi:hypothetical protein